MSGTRLVFRIEGMDCAAEVALLKREVGPLVGGEGHLLFDVLAGRMTADTAGPVDPTAIQEAVARTGMSAALWEDGTASESRPRMQGLLIVLSGALTLIGFATGAWPFHLAAVLAGGWLVVPRALRAVLRLRPDMNLLMLVAVLGAMGIGEWFEAATVTFLFALSLWLESWSVGRARRAVEALLDLSPQSARILDEDGEREVAAASVAVGQIFVVMPGQRIPLDGRVVRGASEVDQSPITGESLPAGKAEGDEVFAGTINGPGALEIRSTRGFGDTTLARIVRLVEEARSRRAPSERWVERFARVYTPLVMGLALLVLVGGPWAFGGAWSDWFYRSLVLLVIACPCALVISTPVSIVAALAAAARNGVLIKGGAHLETPSRLRAVALDKTGTLTEGRPVVVEVVPLDGHAEADVLRHAAALEARSEHPLARAVLEYAASLGVHAAPAEDHQSVRGKGATARIDGRPFWVGSHRYLEERGQETPEVHEHLERMSGAARTVVVVGNESHVCGLIALADEPRPGAAEAVSALKRAGIETIVMLTGDNRATARRLASRTGIDEVHAELLPEDKVAVVDQLVARYGVVAMVGDGINDAPALARASLGIVMGGAGSDAAVETADVALVSDDLGKLPWLVGHSRRTLRIIRQNVAFSLGLKLIFLVLAGLGLASLWLAIAADMGASLLVIANGLRLLDRRGSLLLLAGLTAGLVSCATPAEAPEPVIVYRGASDASAAVALDGRTILVADDEDNTLRAYAVEGGLPLWRHDLTALLAPTTRHPEADIEGAVRTGDRVYWITSHARNKNGKWRADRYRFFATEVRVSPQGVRLAAVGKACSGLAEVLATDPALQDLGLAEAIGGDRREERLAPRDGGLNIEGLAATPDGKRFYIGLRNPLAVDPQGGAERAIVIPLSNPAEVVEQQAAPRFGAALLWDLDGRGIRGMTYANRQAAFFIVAGPRGEGRGFALYRWSGTVDERPVFLRRLDPEGAAWAPEALVAFDGSARLLALSDDGAVPVRVTRREQCAEDELRDDGTCPNKQLRSEDNRSFRGRWIEP